MPTSRPDRAHWLALALLASAQFMVVLDATIVNVALPSIQADLGFSQANLAWVINAYVLTFGGFLLLGGRFADLLGRRRVFQAGLFLFAGASLACGLATAEGFLVGARVVQGLGAALVAPAALSIITTTFTEARERNIALGVWGGVAGAAGAAGVLLGGFLTEQFGWEWVFYINLPIGAAGVLLAFALISETRREEAAEGFDLPGALSVTSGLALLVYALVQTDEHGWTSGRTLGLLGGALALLLAFVLIERSVSHPLVRPDLFRLRALAIANSLGILLGGAVLTSMFFFVSLYLQLVLGYAPQKAGLAFLPLALLAVVSAGVVSQAVDRLGIKPVLVTSLALLAGGLAWFAQIDAGGTYLGDVLGPSLVAGAGLGAGGFAVTAAATADVPEREAGLASGLINSALQVGGAIGLATLVSLATKRTEDLMAAAQGNPAALPTALTEGFQRGLYVGAGVMAAAALIALVGLPQRTRAAINTSADLRLHPEGSERTLSR